jgi:hypothetical protein
MLEGRGRLQNSARLAREGDEGMMAGGLMGKSWDLPRLLGVVSR